MLKVIRGGIGGISKSYSPYMSEGHDSSLTGNDGGVFLSAITANFQLTLEHDKWE